jgi:predicted acetyltransferase
MEIKFYDDVKDDYGVTIEGLSAAAFWGFWSRERIEVERKYNPFHSKEFAIYAIEGDELIGQVKLYEFPIETTEGLETIGGIGGVLTHPAFSRRGTAKKLMERTHEIFLEKGIRFSFLRTSRSIVAFDLYAKLGYEIVSGAPFAIKRLPKNRKKEPKLNNCTSYKQGEGMSKVFDMYVDGLLGWVRRPRDFFTWRIREKLYSKKNDIVLVKNQDDEIQGYAFKSKREDIMEIYEIAALSQDDFSRLCKGLMTKGTNSMLMWEISNPIIRKGLAKLGFTIFEDTWICHMAVDLKRGIRGEGIKALVGVPQRFNFMACDGY